ncbi:MAG: fatty acid desaturase [Actinomycetota bacterium]|nr:fatty acid desaturase [Actinomycetota bacterium]
MTTAPINPTRARPQWATDLDPYSRPVAWRTWLDIATSIVPYLALSVCMYLLLDVSYWLVLAVGIPAAGFLLRTFILFHDCTHGSLFKSRKANNAWGVGLGLVVMHPFSNWRWSHAAHHGSAGDLDRRGQGDVPTMTLAEWRTASTGAKVGYWLFRHPAVMFTIGPLWSLVIGPRIPPKNGSKKLVRSVHLTNLALLFLVGGVCVLIGPIDYLLIQAPTVFLAGSAGVWLFYVQHQFEDVYWENADTWKYEEAALQGSSYLRLPQPLQFFTGNIGLHHVHHLNARIPNYNLQRAHDDNEIFHSVPILTFMDGIRCTRLKLWDEEGGRLITFAEARRLQRPAPAQISSASSS